MSTITITIDHEQTTKLFLRQLITAREAATEIHSALITEHPILAEVEPRLVLAAVVGLPAKIAEALDTPDPMLLAKNLLATPDTLGEHEESWFPMRADLVLRVWRIEWEGTTSRFAGELRPVGMRGRAFGDEVYAGPWFTRHLGTLLAIGMDNADQLDLHEGRAAR